MSNQSTLEMSFGTAMKRKSPSYEPDLSPPSKRMHSMSLSNSSATTQSSESHAEQYPLMCDESDTWASSAIIHYIGRYRHRLEFKHRPKVNCAADHPEFRRTTSLTYTWLSLEEEETDENGKLTRCRLYCTFCGKAYHRGWNWTRKRTGKSTRGYLEHFRKHHAQDWAELERVDKPFHKPKRAHRRDVLPTENKDKNQDQVS